MWVTACRLPYMSNGACFIVVDITHEGVISSQNVLDVVSLSAVVHPSLTRRFCV